ncbi:MAG: hypothetical protein DSZ25_01070 [Thermovibrio sp.]|nr:MAG: hypothetical protein DSZ25_01070 [Thermovibrio sp.]
MALFSCYVDVERFLGEPVKELVHFLVCLRKKERVKVIGKVAEFFQYVDHLRQFFEFKREKREEFLSLLPLSNPERRILWKLIENFFTKHSENSSGKPIPQDDLIALRKGRLFEELVFHLGPIEKGRVELLSMHCQPMVNRRILRVFCKDRELSGKNIDVAFWGRDYVEGYECKGNVEFFLRLGFKGGEKGRKVREKVFYLNQLSKLLKRFFEARIYLASFAPDIDLEWCRETSLKWLRECGEDRLEFEIITVNDFLSEIH